MGLGRLSTTWHLLYDLRVTGGQTTAVISDITGGHGLPQLEVYEQASPGVPVTSEFSTQEGNATEHQLLFLSLLWEHTHPATAPAKCSRCLSLARDLQLGSCTTFPQALATVKGPATRHWLLALPIASISLQAHTAP